MVPNISQHSISKMTGEGHEETGVTVLSEAGRKTAVTLQLYMAKHRTRKREGRGRNGDGCSDEKDGLLPGTDELVILPSSLCPSS